MRIARPLIQAGLMVLALGTTPLAAQQAAAPPILETETSDVATLPPATPHRFFILTGTNGVVILDGDTTKMLGTVNAAFKSSFAIAPDDSEYYVAETIWSKGNRGIRQDMVSIYDGKTLLLKGEIPLPGRLIATGRIPQFDLSLDGRRGYVFDSSPAPSVITVDLAKRKLLSRTDVPGCGLVYPIASEGFVSLCADGSLISVMIDAKGKSSAERSAVFFDAEHDPVFEDSPVDRKGRKAFFITYTGMVYPAALSAKTAIGEPWSLQRAAGLGAATTDPDDTTWRPGGRKPFAYHPASGRLYVLMHNGKHWSQKAAGSEVWVYDVKEKRRIARFELMGAGATIDITPDAKPQLYIVADSGAFWNLDPETGRVVKLKPNVGKAMLTRVEGY